MSRGKDKNKIDLTSTGFEAKWGPDVASQGFTPIPNALLRNLGPLGISAPELVTFLAILSHEWRLQNAYPSVETVAGYQGKDTSTVRDHTRSLEKKDVIKRIARTGTSNEYSTAPIKNRLIELCSRSEKLISPYLDPDTPAMPKSNNIPYQNPDTKEDSGKQDLNINTHLSSDDETGNERLKESFEHIRGTTLSPLDAENLDSLINESSAARVAGAITNLAARSHKPSNISVGYLAKIVTEIKEPAPTRPKFNPCGLNGCGPSGFIDVSDDGKRRMLECKCHYKFRISDSDWKATYGNV